jgi:hypothetical protein
MEILLNKRHADIKEFILAANYFLTAIDNIRGEPYCSKVLKNKVNMVEKEIMQTFKHEILKDILKHDSKEISKKELDEYYKEFYKNRKKFFDKLLSFGDEEIEMFMLDVSSGMFDNYKQDLNRENETRANTE